MRRFKTLFKIVLVAVAMLAAAEAPVAAKTATEKPRAVQVRRADAKKQTNFFMVWLSGIRSKISRYAMAAN